MNGVTYQPNFSFEQDSATGDNLLRTHDRTRIGGQQFIFPFGEALAGKKYDDVSVQFQYNYLDTQFDVNTSTTGAGAAVGAANSVAYATTTSDGEVAYISSRDSIRYRPGHSGFIDFTLAADVSGGGYVHGGGFGVDMKNGFCVEIDQGGMAFGFFQDGTKKGSNYQSGFDTVDTTGITLSNLNIYRIAFGYLGVANPTLFVRYGGVWRKLHEVQTEGLANATHTETPVFPLTIMAHDGGKVYTASWNGGVIGNGSLTGNRPFHFPNTIIADGAAASQGEMTLTGTDVGTVVIFNAKDTYQGKTNNVKSRLLGYNFEVDVPAGNVYGEVVFQLVGVQTLSGTPAYTDINTTASVIRYDHTAGAGASVDVTAGVPVAQEALSYVGSSKGGVSGSTAIDAERIGAFAYAGDVFAIIAKDLGGNGVTVRVALNWEELF